MKHSSAELKKFARIALKGNYGTMILTYIILEAIIFLALIVTSLFFGFNAGMTSLIIQLCIQFMLSFIWVIFGVGFAYQSMKVCRKEPISVVDLFYGFSHNPDRFIVLSLLELLFAIALFAPAIIVLVITLIASPNLLFGALAIVFILYIAAAVLLVILTLALSLCFYLIIDNPGMQAMDAIKTSWQLMKGNKGRMFYLSLSFLGLMLLAIFSFGIGFLWVVPYMNVTAAYFYFDVIGALNPTIAPVTPVAPLEAPMFPATPITEPVTSAAPVIPDTAPIKSLHPDAPYVDDPVIHNPPVDEKPTE